MADIAKDDELRRHVRDWLTDNIPPDLRRSRTYEDRLAVDRLLGEGGWLGYTWPTEFGGRGGTPREAIIVDDELARGGISAAGSPSRQGFRHLGPTLLVHGKDGQRQEFLPRIRNLSDIWCQGFSEPGAGSDLASVSTRAELVGDVFRLNGSKIWTTHAQYANWCYVLARTAPGPRHHNLTFLMVPMHQPGITVRPIKQLAGGTEFNEVWFDDAETSADNVIGELNDGWSIAVTTLSTERGFNLISHYRGYLEELGQMASRASAETDLIAIGDLYAQLLGIEAISARIMQALETSMLNDTALASGGKLVNTEFHQRMTEIALGLSVNSPGLAGEAFITFLEARAETIYGGTSQIQRNILAERVLGLPR
jgi:alkylation response protein AidB-like acyl-CoA dehydrogenase